MVIRSVRTSVLVVVVALASVGCRPTRQTSPAPVSPPAAVAPPVDTARVHALLLNGGGSPRQNFQSHLLHVRQVLALLEDAGVPPDQIDVFGSDGEDPGLDLALRKQQPEAGFWLLEGTRLAAALRTPVTFESTSLPGVTIRPATQAALADWFATTGKTLASGDTLLFYVTDHGTRGAKDPTENAITLWGKDERLTVRELADLIGTLPAGVRVVALMSQCFSGGFADLPALAAAHGKPAGEVCGYFSSTADRMAYGCYPENRGKDNVGHSFRFLEAVAEVGSFPAAHESVLVSDTTPDVPLRTSDVYAETMLVHAAEAAGVPLDAFIDGLLAEAWRDRGRHEEALRLLDRTSAAFGMFSPRSLAELDAQAGSLPNVGAELDSYKQVWRQTLHAATSANLERFLAADPAWGARLTPARAIAITPAEARQLTPALLADLGAATAADAAVETRLETLRDRGRENAAVAYRMAVREAVVLRLRALLTDVAARTYLERRGGAAARQEAAALLACESFTLPRVGGSAHALTAPERFPPLEDDLALARATMPGWLGIQFRPAPESVREKRGLGAGAVSVVAVYPNSPASAAGLRVGDVVIGPPDAPFAEDTQVREWTMLSTLDQERTLRVLRGERPTDVTITPGARPLKWPSLPGPPKVGAAAPALGLTPYRGTPPTELTGAPRLLFFWATWCGVCKAALPELAAYEKASGTQVVAISDEDPAQLDRFFAGHRGPFPDLVAVDELRRSFLAYGVSGMPTFVLVTADGTVRQVQRGYSRAKGLELPGWTPLASAPAAPPRDPS